MVRKGLKHPIIRNEVKTDSESLAKFGISGKLGLVCSLVGFFSTNTVAPRPGRWECVVASF